LPNCDCISLAGTDIAVQEMHNCGKAAMMETERNNRISRPTNEPFVQRISLELKRAERYRIFVSLVVLDLSFLKGRNGNDRSGLIDGIVDIVSKHIRVIDQLSLIDRYKLVVLMPETQRQGAEAAARRLTDLVRNDIENRTHDQLDRMIPLEMASFPDAAGARSISDIIREFSEAPSQN